MVSKDDIVYIKPNPSSLHNISVLGSGFNSKSEIEQKIRDEYNRNPGMYEYGVLYEEGTVEIEKPPDKNFSNNEKKILNELINKENTDSRIKHTKTYKSTHSSITCSIFKSHIRYKNGEVDFSFTLNNDLFDDVPISTNDITVEKQIMDIFEDIIDDNAEYLGYQSSYASRGRRNPFVTIYGRIHRDSRKDKEFRKTLNENCVLNIYWSDDNISPIPIYTIGDNTEEYRDSDITLILNHVSANDSYDEIESEIMDDIYKNIKQLEKEYNLIVNWIGKTFYNKESMQICIGVEYNG